jgi:hypothetical protein
MPPQRDAEANQSNPTNQSAPDMQPGPRDARARLRWRAVVHPGDKFDPSRGQQPVAWHLAECDDPTRAEAHCDIGRHLIATDGNPDGHCQVAGVCPRCPGTRGNE